MRDRGTDIFLDHFGIRPELADRALLHALGHAFSALPYENLTKLIKKHTVAPGPERRRLPQEVMIDHLERGTGGTCFALTMLFGKVLERSGYRCFPVLCETRHRLAAGAGRPQPARQPAARANHCALLVLLDGEPQLIDPGYLLHEPVPLHSARDASGPTPADSRICLRHVLGDSAAVDLYTYGAWRYRARIAPVSTEQLAAVWDASFDWTMMNNIHVCSVHGAGYGYVHGSKLRLQDGQSKQTLSIRGREAAVLAEQFGIAADVVLEAYHWAARARAGAR